MDICIEGNVCCGFPSPGEENREEPLDFNELLVKHKAATFCLRAYGDSMTPVINCNDILIVDRSLQSVPGDIVVAEVNGDFTVKYLRKTGNGQFSLVPENPQYKEFLVDDSTHLFGVVTSVIKQVRT